MGRNDLLIRTFPKVHCLREQGLGATSISRQLKIARSTVYKILATT
ncbi:helix-turn-helix domain-containing protein [Raoultella ornithinolytica]|nr:helix-turn-helix domain-containing protein [Raoultella ornithinolytica]MDV1102249.1 helix-turn-helix domain-containing protein [Raoultella ornithinolytica]